MLSMDFMQLLRNLAGFASFCVVIGLGVYLIYRLAKAFLRACKGANKTVKAFAGIGVLILILTIGIAVFWVSVISFLFVSGTSSLH